MNQRSLVAPRSVAAALVWAVIATAGVVWASFSDPGERTASMLATLLRLAVCVLPLVWAAFAAPGRAARGHEALILLGVSAPALILAASLSGLTGDAATRGALYAVLVLALCAALVGRGAPSQRGARFAACALWLGASPTAVAVGSDVAGIHLPWLSPLLALEDVLSGRPATPALAALAAVAALVALVAWGPGRRAPPRWVSATALSLGLLLATVSLAQPRPQPLLRGHVRPGAAYPLRVDLDADSSRVVAESYRQRFSAEPQGDRVHLVPTPAGSGRRLDLWSGSLAGTLEPFVPPLATPSRVSPRTVLVASLGREAAQRAASWFPAPEATRIALDRADLPLVAQAGEALDVIVASDVGDESVAAALRTWAAAGGTLVLTSSQDMARVTRDSESGRLAAAGAPGSSGPDVRPIGGGLLVAPRAGTQLPLGTLPEGLNDRVRGRLRSRARDGSMTATILSSAEPGPSDALAARIGWAALAALACFCVLAPLRGRVAATPFASGTLALGLGLAAVFKAVAAPPSPVYATSLTVLEAPAGARVARRLRWLTLATLRPTQASLRLADRVVPRPAFAAAQDAVQAELSVHVDAAGTPRLDLPLRRARRTFVLPDAVDLGGAFRLTRGSGGRSIRIQNDSPHGLLDSFALVRGGLYPLPDLPPGSTHELDLLAPPIPFRRWRLSALDHATRSWRSLVTSALSGRDLDGALLLIGRTRPTACVADGVAEERAQAPLLVITASAETR